MSPTPSNTPFLALEVLSKLPDNTPGLGPNGGKASAAVLDPEARSADHNGEILPGGILGLHGVKNARENTAVHGIQSEQPWHTMAAHMICRGATNSEIALAANVHTSHVSQLRAQRWFQQRLAVIEHESGEALKGSIDGAALAAFNRIVDIAEGAENERTRLAANLAIIEHSIGKPTQKILSSVSHSSMEASEEMASIQQQLAALRSSAERNEPKTLTLPQ